MTSMRRGLILASLLIFAGCGLSREVVTLRPQPNACEAFELRRLLSGLAWAVCYDAQARPFGVASGNAKAVAEILRDVAGLAAIVGGAALIGGAVNAGTNVTVTGQ